ncbi:sensor domain-containing protein, partial [Streptomyces platensis]|uniref:sensor domain-containing protein n=1 Tax=Streptomyces platensis TaxID=58346 RepID=UPI003CD0766A
MVRGPPVADACHGGKGRGERRSRQRRRQGMAAPGRTDDETMDTAYAPRLRGSRMPVGLRAPFSGRTWREFLYLFLSVPMSVLMFTYAITVLALGTGLLVTTLGIPVLAGGLAGSRALGGLERGGGAAPPGGGVGAPPPPPPPTPPRRAGVGGGHKK